VDKLVIVGDDIVVTQDAGGNWVEIPAPPASNGGWGQLRGLYGDGTRIWAVGLAGVVWSCTDPLGEWNVESLGVNVDLFGVCGHDADTRQVMIVGAQGTVFLGDPGAGWAMIDANTSVDILDCSESTLLAADGAVTELRSEGDFVSVGTFAGARGIWHEAQNDLVVVGAAGMATRVEDYECVG
jgi:hypothetical protein